MKKICPVCEERRGKRICLLREEEAICPQCCVAIRSADTCTACEHWSNAQRSARARAASSHRENRDFIIAMDPEIERAVDDALVWLERGDDADAMARLTRLRRQHPQNHLVCYAIGTVHAMRKEGDLAIEWFDRAIAIFPYFAEAIYNRAVAFYQRYDVAGAIRGFRDTLELTDHSDICHQEARSQLSQMAKVLKKEEGLSLDDYLRSHDEFVRAFDFLERGAYREALKSFEKVLALRRASNPRATHVPTLGNMGICLACLGRKAEAIAALNEALEVDPTYEPAQQNLALVREMEEGSPLNAKFTSTHYGIEKTEQRNPRRGNS